MEINNENLKCIGLSYEGSKQAMCHEHISIPSNGTGITIGPGQEVGIGSAAAFLSYWADMWQLGDKEALESSPSGISRPLHAIQELSFSTDDQGLKLMELRMLGRLKSFLAFFFLV